MSWVDDNTAATDGSRVFLPQTVDRYPNPADNFAWFKVIATHQVAHVEFGSFQFAFERPAAVFAFNRRAQRETQALRPADLGSALAATDMGRFMRLFANRHLAYDLFSVLEDCRLDYRIQTEYPGIRGAAARAQAEALTERPAIDTLPAQDALVELLLHLSLERFSDLPTPTAYADTARMLARLVHALRSTEATVEDAAEAALRAYDLVSRVANETEASWERLDLGASRPFAEADYEALLGRLPNPLDKGSYNGLEPVDFRGSFKPELVQLIEQLQADGPVDGDQPALTQDMVKEALQESAEWMSTSETGDDADDAASLAQELMQQAGARPSDNTLEPDPGAPQPQSADAGGPPLSPEPGVYLYDEWDFSIAAYQPQWCKVHEKVLEEGETDRYNDALIAHSALLRHIKQQFERIMPERMRKTYRLVDGEDIDLNAALEAWMDLRMNVPPDDKIYWRRHIVQRDVAVVFLLDMSASTAEFLTPLPPPESGPSAPADSISYQTWRQRRSAILKSPISVTQPTRKRIVDVETDSAVLLIQALESIGDTYGIYGFSGYGRDNVEVYVIKDIAERFTDRIKRRIDHIHPLQATRMGAAIRHAITKLDTQSAATKILFLFSDGRPQDRGYSRPGDQQAYAVQDTRMALLEARQQGITPFCLTIDKSGHDYLQAMCGDMGYEVLDDIASLPARLPMLYRALTLRAIPRH